MKKLIVAAVAAAAAGCATVQIPSERLVQSQAAIRSAEELGAANDPSARLHLKLAQDQERVARQLAERGDARAHVVLARAQADADLAIALAREAQVRSQTEQAAHAIQMLQQSNGESR